MKQRDNNDESALLIGIGNEYRSDDGLGIYVVRELRRRLDDNIRVVELSGEGTSLMASWRGVGSVLIVDAVVSGQPPGMLHRIDGNLDTIPRRFFNSSSHTFGVAEAIALARQLDELPRTLILYGIEGESFEAGVGLSETVVRVIPDLIHVVEHEIELMKRVSSHLAGASSFAHVEPSLNSDK